MGMFGSAFKPGGTGRNIAGYIGDALLTASGNRPQFADARQQAIENDFRNRQLDLQGQIANTRADTEPAVIKALRAAHIDPTSPQGQAIVQNNLNRPIIAGGIDGGDQRVFGGAFGMPGAVPQGDGVPTVSDQASYDAIPSGGQFKDPQGNVRVKP